jgi:hypothetical protein
MKHTGSQKKGEGESDQQKTQKQIRPDATTERRLPKTKTKNQARRWQQIACTDELTNCSLDWCRDYIHKKKLQFGWPQSGFDVGHDTVYYRLDALKAFN